MINKAKNDSDGIINTTTDLIKIVGRLEKKIDKRFDLMQAEQADFKQETRERFDQMQAEQADFKQETRERFDQLELLIRQLLPNNPN